MLQGGGGFWGSLGLFGGFGKNGLLWSFFEIEKCPRRALFGTFRKTSLFFEKLVHFRKHKLCFKIGYFET